MVLVAFHGDDTDTRFPHSIHGTSHITRIIPWLEAIGNGQRTLVSHARQDATSLIDWQSIYVVLSSKRMHTSSIICSDIPPPSPSREGGDSCPSCGRQIRYGIELPTQTRQTNRR
ncbi:hypothetical protein CGRA01v4_09316 [Colletotrichum graminicola]|nr:hypothetical protein CGRA01v4_09316 [Colletotrichum graminicola]